MSQGRRRISDSELGDLRAMLRQSFMDAGVEYGCCQCGCGERTTIANRTEVARGWVRGEPRRFRLHHHHEAITGDGNRWWHGGRFVDNGYVYVKCYGHPFSTRGGYVREHRLVMEDRLNRYLWPWEQVHHVNGDRADNRPDNLELTNASDHIRHHRPGDVRWGLS